MIKMNITPKITRTELLFILFAVLISGSACREKRLIEYVNPFIGTGDHGHTFPAASLPGGLVQLGPDTDIKGWDWCSGYHYSDSSIMGFSHLHRSGMGAGDWGDVMVMPATGKLKIQPGDKNTPGAGYRSRFSHNEEEACPGYYAVRLKDYDINAELTVTPRTGLHRYTFPESDSAHILIDLKHGIHDSCTNAYVKITGDREIEGWRSSTGFIKGHKVYFFAQFSKPFSSYGTWNILKINQGSKEESGNQIGVFVNYITSAGEQIELRVGISYTGIDQARLNLLSETAERKFNRIREEAGKLWESELGKIKVEFDRNIDRNYKIDRLVTFYSALYHSLIFPALYCDADGKYTGIDDQVYTAKGFGYSSDFSLWDTFRAEMPLLALIRPDRSRDAICTMISQYEQGGWLPTPQQFGNSYTNDMIGDHPAVVILDAYRKGIKDFDIVKAWEAVKKNAMETPEGHRSRGRVGLKYYLKYGYLPYDKVNQSVSRTLEYAFNDWCIAMLAKSLGRSDDYDLFIRRAMNYRNVIDTASGLARPRDSTGKWLSPFNPTFIGNGKERHYTEANAWQYTWFVPHDINGLIELEGGREKFVSKLDTLFTMSSEIQSTVSDVTGLIGQYAHGNEPSHHTLYLYDYAGVPWKTQSMVRKVMDDLYNSGPSGLCGNEDMGQMSAWFVFSAMGFYPVTPGQNTYAIGSPVFSKVTISPGKTRKFVIKAENNSAKNKYIRSATLNSEPYDKPWFSQSDLKEGGILLLKMGPEPNRDWGSAPDAAPPSMSGRIN
jgi:predicted alpha-1,2-mannosidase